MNTQLAYHASRARSEEILRAAESARLTGRVDDAERRRPSAVMAAVTALFSDRRRARHSRAGSRPVRIGSSYSLANGAWIRGRRD